MANRILIGILWLGICLSVQATARIVPYDDLHPGALHERATGIILHIIDTYHYKNRPLDDDLSGTILDNYLDNLDPNRSFFTARDVASFEPLRYELDDALKKPDLTPAFTIFRKYRRRVEQWSDYAVQLLDQDFDFSIDEDYRFDRRDLTWSKDDDALKELWRKRIKNDLLSLRLAKKDHSKIKETLSKRYRRLRTSTAQLNANDVFQGFINAYTTAIEPHTAYFSPRTSENFDISMRLSLEGIGAVLSAATDYTKVERIIPGGPADLSGLLHEDDKIIGVAQGDDGTMEDVIGWRLDDVVDLIRGNKGTVVYLDILPKGTGIEGPSKTIAITRDRIRLEEQAAQSDILELKNGGRIGVIDVPTFYSDFAAQARGEQDYRSTTRDVRQLLDELKDRDLDGLIIDLRSNGGGSLSEALDLTGLFIESGPIVQTRDSSGRIDINRDPNPDIAYGGPLAVLVDRNSASASEIFAGAIQDYRRGIIVGEPTYGKGTVQNIVDLNRFVRSSNADYGRLKTTIAQFFRISGGSNQFKGVVPDVLFPTAANIHDHGERALDNALPWDQVEPAPYVPASAPVDAFAEAEHRYRDRIASDRLFQILMEQLRLTEESGERTSVTLNETKRKAEREALIEKRKALRDEYRALRGLPPIVENDEDDDDDDDDTLVVATEDEDESMDILLEETGRILFDLVMPGHRTAATIEPNHSPPADDEEPVVIFGGNM